MKLAVVGAGNMGTALIRGYIAAGAKGSDVIVCGHHPEKLAELQSELGVKLAEDPKEAAEAAEVLLLAVKPKDTADVLGRVAESGSRPLIISVAAGKTLSDLDSMLSRGLAGCTVWKNAGSAGTDDSGMSVGINGFRIIRAMPNTPAAVGAGMTAICRGEGVTDEDAEMALEIFRSVGRAVEVPENLMDAVTGLSGSGPAFAYIFIEALADGGVAAGLPRAKALEMAAQTVLGSAKMVLETGKGPGDLKDAVCSPGGTTITGVRELEASGFRSAAMEAVIASAEKSADM